MEEKKEVIPVAITVHKNGEISVAMAEENRRRVMITLSERFCGAFDIAGEHDQLVYETIAAIALTRLEGGKGQTDVAVSERDKG